MDQYLEFISNHSMLVLALAVVTFLLIKEFLLLRAQVHSGVDWRVGHVKEDSTQFHVGAIFIIQLTLLLKVIINTINTENVVDPTPIRAIRALNTPYPQVWLEHHLLRNL